MRSPAAAPAPAAAPPAAAPPAAAAQQAAAAPTASAGPAQVSARPHEPPTRDDHDRILFILASARVHGSSTIPASISFGEVVHAWDVFNAAGYAVDIVSPDGGAVPILDDYVSPDVAARLHDARIMDPLRTTFTPAQADLKKGWPENSTVGSAMAPEIQ